VHTVASKGIINIASPRDAVATAKRLEEVLRTNGMNVIARVKHAEAAAGGGMELRPTELLIFGNPQAGTPFMQRNQCAATDFPQKALVWEDETGEVWIGFNDPGYLTDRHGIEEMDQSIDKMRETLEQFSRDTVA
jgi:uncharacterized protein (DUF302 family)